MVRGVGVDKEGEVGDRRAVKRGRRREEERRVGIKKAPNGRLGAFADNCLTITYFHTGFSTIIGAESFHGPVRDGKGWFQLAMVIRHNLSVARNTSNPIWKSVRILVQIVSSGNFSSITIKVIETSLTSN